MMDVAKLIERLRGSDPDRVTPVDALRLHDQDPVTFPLSPEDVEGVLDLIEEVATSLETLQRERDAWRKAAVEAVVPLEALNIAGQGHIPDASWGEIRNGILAVRSTIEQFRALSPKETEK